MEKDISNYLDNADSFFTNKDKSYAGYRIGDYTYGKPSLLFFDKIYCSIGKFCSISAGVKIFGGGGNITVAG